MTVTVEHSRLPAGIPLRVRIVVWSASGWLNGLSVSFGDGQRYAEPPTAAACPARPSPSPPPMAPPSTAVRNLVVTYKSAGVYLLSVSATADVGECGPTQYQPEQLQAAIYVKVTS